MKTLRKYMVGIAAPTLLLVSCTGAPVTLGTKVSGPIPTGTERAITGRACGFQLMLFIPININNRMERAYAALQTVAAGDFITDVKVEESWSYAFVGTRYCTILQAKAIRPLSS